MRREVWKPGNPLEIKNIRGTAMDNKPSGYRSWIEYFQDYGWNQNTCAVGGCTNQYQHGAHEYARKREETRTPSKQWIVPLCPSCNHPSRNEWMVTNKKICLVSRY